MNIFRPLRPNRRLIWQSPAFSFLIVTIVSLVGITTAQRLFFHPTKLGAEPIFRNGSTISRNQPESADAKMALFQKLAFDDARLKSLENKRNRLAPMLGGARQHLHSGPQGSPTIDDERELLTSALVHLLNLEKRENDDNPDIIAVRKQITQLQAQMAQTSADLPDVGRAPPVKRSKNEILGRELDSQINTVGAEIITDLQRLAQQPIPEKPVQLGNVGASAPLNIRWPSVISRISRVHTGLVVAISIALGVIFSICRMIISGHHDRSVWNEAALEQLIPITAEYLGSIPRMKVS